MRRILALVLAALATLLSPPAVAAEDAGGCDLRFGTVPNIAWQGAGYGYDPFDPGPYRQEGSIEVVNRQGACRFFVTASEGAAGDYRRHMVSGDGRLAYNVYDDVALGDIVRDLPTATANAVLTGEFRETAPAQTQRLTYALSIPPGQIAPPGAYRDDLLLTLYEGTIQSHRQVDALRLQVRAAVPAAAQASLVAPGAPFDPGSAARTLAFDAAVEGARRRFDLVVRSNARVSVWLASDNAGALVSPEGGAARTPYSATIDGRPLALGAAPVAVADAIGPTGPEGARFRLEVTVAAPGTAPGRWQDNLAVIVRLE